MLQDGDRTRDDYNYAHQLTVTYGFETPFEAACAYTPALSQVIDVCAIERLLDASASGFDRGGEAP